MRAVLGCPSLAPTENGKTKLVSNTTTRRPKAECSKARAVVMYMMSSLSSGVSESVMYKEQYATFHTAC